MALRDTCFALPLGLILVSACASTHEPVRCAALSGIESPAGMVLVGDTVRFGAVPAPSEPTLPPCRVTWTSSDHAVATIDSTGMAITFAAGSTSVVASDRVTLLRFELVVKEAPARIVVTPSAFALLEGEQITLIAAGLGPGGQPAGLRALRWSSSDSGVALPWGPVDEPVLEVIGVAPGTASLTVAMPSVTGAAQATVGYTAFRDPAAGPTSTCAIAADSTAYCWGEWRGGRALGPRLSPVTGGLRFAALVSDSGADCGLTASGALYCWGLHNYYDLGLAGESPGLVGGGLRFTTVSRNGDHVCGVATDGYAYCWGRNDVGQLGTSTSEICGDIHVGHWPCSWTPLRPDGGLVLVAISAGMTHTCGLLADGRAQCWGANGHGALGDSTTTSRGTPTPVAGGLRFRALAAGTEFTCGVSVAGAAYCWGRNDSGQLGVGSTSDSPYPVAVAGGLVFRSLTVGAAHGCGVTTSDAAYCWGRNESLAVGVPSAETQLTPVRVSGSLSFRSLSAGPRHTCGTTTDGVVHCWGDNGWGELGVLGVAGSYLPVRAMGQRPE